MPQAVLLQMPWMGGGPAQATKAVTVRNIADTADATLYTSTTGATAGPNPVNTDATGKLTVYVAPGRWLLKDAAGNKDEVTVAPPGPDTPTPAAPPAVAGSRGGNAALASLLTGLAAAGVIIDNSTA